MSKKVRLGIIGVGAQGGMYGGLLTGKTLRPGGFQLPPMQFDDIEVGAFCDIDPAVRANITKVLPDMPVYADYKEMIASGNVDAIVTCVPHYLHPEMGCYALEHGIHTLLEKPAGVYTKQVKEVNEVAAKHPELTFGVFFNQRMNPLYQELKKIIDSGEIGAIRRTNWIITTWYRPQAYYNQSAWRATWGGEGGGVLVNQAPHQIDLLQWLCGMPKAISAKVTNGYQRNIVTEDEVTAVLDYGNGATGVFVTCTHDIIGSDRLEILGDKGKIVVEGSKKATVSILSKTEQEINETTKDMMEVYRLMTGNSGDTSLVSTRVIEPTDAWGVQHASILRNFAATILGKEKLVAPGADGINGVKIANAIQLAGWTGKEVSLENFDEDLFLKELNKKIKEEGKFELRK